MKLSSINWIKLAALSLIVLTTGCRPTIEFKSNISSVAPGDEVTLEWEVELAKGTSSSKVTITDVGEVELEGTETITLNDSEDITLRVSTFVLGMPITSKETISIDVIDENFVTWDFEMDSTEGWAKDFAFYAADKKAESLCLAEDDEENPLNRIGDPEIGNLGGSLELCLKNDSDNFVDSEADDKQLLAYVYRQITESDGFEFEKDNSYNIGFVIEYGINFDTEECDKVTEDLQSKFEIVVGVSHDAPEVNPDNDIAKLWVVEFDSSDTDLSYEEGVSSNEFNEIVDKSSTNFLRVDPIGELEYEDNKDAEDYAKKHCELNIPYTASYDSIKDSNFLVREPSDDNDFYVLVGLKSSLLEKDENNEIDDLQIDFYIDTIKVLIKETE